MAHMFEHLGLQLVALFEVIQPLGGRALLEEVCH